jgi:short-subunit dehydrogenase
VPAGRSAGASRFDDHRDRPYAGTTARDPRQPALVPTTNTHEGASAACQFPIRTRGFAHAGAQLALVAREASALQEVISEHGGKAYPADLTHPAATRALIALVERDGPVDILINNAGDERVGPFTDLDAEALEFVVRLNALAPAELCRQIVPRMIARDHGRIVNVSSFAGVICTPNLTAYSATKAFLTQLTVNLEFELKDTPIVCTKVEMGEIAGTGQAEKVRGDPQVNEIFERMYRLHLSRQLTMPEVTDAIINAVRRGRTLVRLPRRVAPASYVSDLFRRTPWLFAR